ncbi:hypothetical protein CP556_21390 [Natrinema sp. CBA1119]|uniref:hypothetical protein n=1 Tax=Natrinema sp. CBA1119 TaxID=1608465 RepID=UPI000BF91F63|nr:hypothetical protein [Natrinema sp. CBA1119]PGF14418.1 hypothetical protein CP556_21390 [Natrinema sp. CBA1119]
MPSNDGLVNAAFRLVSVALVAPIALAFEAYDRLRGRDAEPTATTPSTVEDAEPTETDDADVPIRSDTTAADLLEGFDE